MVKLKKFKIKKAFYRLFCQKHNSIDSLSFFTAEFLVSIRVRSNLAMRRQDDLLDSFKIPDPLYRTPADIGGIG